jgi:CRISPR-associated exonuclease Cas4
VTFLYFGILVIFLAAILFLVAERKRIRSGLPPGKVIYADTSAWGRVEKPLYDSTTNLTGKPDYLVEKQGKIIPVEVKTGRAPKAPYDSHIFQLAAYCLLVERSTGKRPNHGIIHYNDRDFTIAYTPQLEQELLNLINKIRQSEQLGDVPRSHNVNQRCHACGFQAVCDQRLA